MYKKDLEYKHFQLKNGLDVLVLKRPERYTVGYYLILRAGSIFETDETSGVSHYFEHLIFDGTKNYPTERALREREIEIGLGIGAYTDYNAVVLHASSPISEIENSLRHIKEMAFESLILPKAVAKEKEILLSEEGLRRDNVSNEVWDLALKTRFIGQNPLRLLREGTPLSIRKMTPDQVRNAYKKHISAKNALLIVGSKLPFGKAKRIIEESIEAVNPGEKVKIPDTSETSGFKIFAKTKDLNQIYLGISFPYFSPSKLVDRWKSGFVMELVRENLFRRLVLDEGLVHTFSAEGQKLSFPTEIIYIGIACSLTNVELVLKIAFEEIEKLKKEIDQKLFEKIRETGNKKLPMNWDNLADSMGWVADSFYNEGKIYSPEEVIKARNVVKVKDLRITAAKMFNLKMLNAVSYGPINQKELERTIKSAIP